MDIKYVCKTLGKLLTFFSFVFVIPISVAIYYTEDFKPFLLSALTSALIGLIMCCVKSEMETPRYKEAFAVVSIGWLLVSVVGSIPYVLIGIKPIDAFFESMSGFTTTGASVLTPELLPKSVLIWRSLTQWLGGMGIIVLFLAFFPSIAKSGVTLFQAEYTGITVLKVKPRLRDTVISLYLTYMFFTVLEITVLKLLGVPIFDAINHAFTTLSTGGYSTHSESISYFKDFRVEFAIAFFAAIGGMNFALLYYLLRGDLRIFRDPEFRLYIFLILLFTTILTILNLKRFDFFNSFRYSIFQVISIMTTTGYTTYDFDLWSDSARFILLLLMFIGGCSGSTAGGIKVLRMYILTKYSAQQVLRSAEPKTVRLTKYGDLTVKRELIDSITTFFTLYIFIFIVSTLIIALFGYDIVTSISASAATLGNVGPGLGLAGASENYANFNDLVKLLLIFNMWVGRLEIFSVLAIFIPHFWRE